MMDTDKCKALLCALTEGTMAQAAAKLGYTPSGISRMLAGLEQETGFPLLYRSKEGVRITKECELLLPMMRELVYQEERYQQAAAAVRGLTKGSITVGIAHYDILFTPLTKLMASFHEKYPGIQFKVVEGISTELAEALEQRRLDLCIISKRKGVPRWVPLVHDELMVMLASDNPLAELSAIPLESLTNESYIDIHADRESDNSLCLAKNNIKLMNKFASVNDTTSAQIMVEAGLGIAMLNGVIAKTMQGKVVFRPLQPAQPVEIGMATQLKAEMPPATHKFIEYVEENFGEQGNFA